jgi:beta-glucosidase
MTLANEITMVEGQGTAQPYVFYMAAQPSLCIPAMGLEDGPLGVGDGLTGVTQLPSGASLAATFDTSLARRYGAVIGQEEWGKGAAVNLGPTVNILRDPRWGRSFEAFTEDPFLNAALAVSEIRGVQDQGEMSRSSTSPRTTRRRTATPRRTTSSSATAPCTRSTCRPSSRR